MIEHDCPGPDCFLCRVRSVSVSYTAMPSRKPEVVSAEGREKELVKDMRAFKAMREQGIQPGRLKGAAELQDKATTLHEIETGKILPKQIAGKVEQTVKELAKK